jgi:hypothetical protein
MITPLSYLPAGAVSLFPEQATSNSQINSHEKREMNFCMINRRCLVENIDNLGCAILDF